MGYAIVFWIYIMGIAAYVLSTVVCDTLLFLLKNKSWKGYSLAIVDIEWLLFWASWLGAWLVVEDFLSKLKSKK